MLLLSFYSPLETSENLYDGAFAKTVNYFCKKLHCGSFLMFLEGKKENSGIKWVKGKRASHPKYDPWHLIFLQIFWDGEKHK